MNSASPAARRRFILGAPALFVVLWSTGFIGTKFGMPYAEPFTFLAVRFSISAALLTCLAVVTGAPWPRSWREGGHIVVAGLLVHGCYLTGVFNAVNLGITTGLIALITGLQPLLIATLVGRVLGEKVTIWGWTGFALGFVGLGLVVWERATIGTATTIGLLFSVIALVGISAGSLYQKRFCSGMDLRSGSAIQLGASSLVMMLAALMFETGGIQWTGEFVFALFWLIVVLSVSAVSLLYYLLRNGEAARVSSLFYLTPAVTAVMGFLIFGETLGVAAIVGIVVAGAGVSLINR